MSLDNLKHRTLKFTHKFVFNININIDDVPSNPQSTPPN